MVDITPLFNEYNWMKWRAGSRWSRVVTMWRPAIPNLKYRDAVKAMSIGTICPICRREVVKYKKIVWQSRDEIHVKLVVFAQDGQLHPGRARVQGNGWHHKTQIKIP